MHWTRFSRFWINFQNLKLSKNFKIKWNRKEGWWPSKVSNKKGSWLFKFTRFFRVIPFYFKEFQENMVFQDWHNFSKPFQSLPNILKRTYTSKNLSAQPQVNWKATKHLCLRHCPKSLNTFQQKNAQSSSQFDFYNLKG